MSLFKDLDNQRAIYEAKKLDKLSPIQVGEIEKNIRDGAKDEDQNWSSALELLHKAFEVAMIDRPTPAMKNAWSQYEELISYSVKQLAKNRGVDGNWRTISPSSK